ncbi:M56 family metallopeptidase [Prevotella fusca]|uniref:TonB-dependent receptor n=1 Tax=Prevotella fusca JCM 17724 TaxID=1236517 RepID=A0A0K1NNL0_9BACT|nr:M56 family metallopeptidase [Prevotella fusca]AKU70664.1 TonB-dependent receptor [Prevotella fusca JCM 17724]
MIMYFLKLNISLILLFCFYKLMFSSDTFFSWRRATLIGMYFIAMLIPGFDCSDWVNNHPGMASMASDYASIILPAVSVTSEKGTVVDWEIVALAIYCMVVSVLLLCFSWQLVSIIRLRNKCQIGYVNGTEVYLLEGNENPFSFFRWIFLNPEKHNRRELDEILMHEQAHCRQLHSIDVLFAELFVVFFWINPFVWLLKREVRLNLEYLADSNVLASGKDSKEYQYHLLGLTYRKNVATISNNFNVLPLKKRIKMMNKKKTKGLVKMKYALYIPLVAMLLVVSNIEMVARSVTEVKNNIATVKTSVEQQRNKKQQQSGEVYTVTEIMPTFRENVNLWLSKKVKYPAAAVKKKEEGRVIIKFIISPTGEVQKPQIIRSVSPSLDKEALRVISSMPKWNPGKQNGKPVAVYYTLPISFKLR